MVFIMKKVLPCLAVAALMVTGCAPSTKVNEKKFTEEVTNYGVFLNNNVKFEGNATMGEMEVQFALLSESDGANVKLHATITYLNGEAEGASMQAVLIGEVKEDKFNGNAYMNEGAGWGTSPMNNVPMEEIKSQLVEITYLAPVEYKDVKYDSKEKGYVFDKFVTSIRDGDMTIAATFKDGELKFKGGELISYKYDMAVGTNLMEIDLARTQKGGVTVTAPALGA